MKNTNCCMNRPPDFRDRDALKFDYDIETVSYLSMPYSGHNSLLFNALGYGRFGLKRNELHSSTFAAFGNTRISHIFNPSTVCPAFPSYIRPTGLTHKSDLPQFC